MISSRIAAENSTSTAQSSTNQISDKEIFIIDGIILGIVVTLIVAFIVSYFIHQNKQKETSSQPMQMNAL
ncbi:hypothetical protein TVAGG3_0999120 [Trichomonas vaginalis G3]|uniref:hypothetical protein n=1 Tax=Trichomonas vaginalis (strain ATCC PRA-98 / G3) TaxID=412133 RepID=UPI0021E5B867|nr:hypothetical protein TVAGG3_0999120 [Trichomonas vaginalis G3]KAI5490643.1 hypothetical protein TVAGG3_0999120 [Trichomonas vaginalis G3]